MDKFSKLNISMRYWLLGMAQHDESFLKAIAAFDYAAGFHTGKRKDGVTPEFYHQLCIGHYLRTLHHGLDRPAETLTAAALHDVREDYFVPHEEIEALFGANVAKAVEALTKINPDNTKKDTQAYFDAIAACPIASVVKGADRIHNLQSMLGVFSAKKQAEYLEESQTYFLPMVKKARRQFYSQEPVYENIKLMLDSQIQLFKAIHMASE